MSDALALPGVPRNALDPGRHNRIATGCMSTGKIYIAFRNASWPARAAELSSYTGRLADVTC